MCDKTFLTRRVTNKDIYEKLMEIEEQTTKTNGTVNWHTKAIGGIFVLVCGIIATLGGMIP